TLASRHNTLSDKYMKPTFQYRRNPGAMQSLTDNLVRKDFRREYLACHMFYQMDTKCLIPSIIVNPEKIKLEFKFD
ncbi:MAG: hypothetical protein WCS96_13965, partial [Victivallales bacterium]